MRHAIVAATFLLAACGSSTEPTEINADEAVTANEPATNVNNELIENPDGTQTLRLEGNDTAVFVDGELVEVNRAE